MFFLFLHLFFLAHLCASYLFPFTLCSIQSTSTFTTIVIMQFLYSFPCPYLIVATSCHFLFLLPFFLSSAVGHCSVDLGRSVSASHSRPFQFLHALNAPTPLPCLHFPASLSIPSLHVT